MGDVMFHSMEAPLHDVVHSAVARALDFLAQAQFPDGGFSAVTSTRRDMSGECSPDPAVFPAALITYSLAFVPATEKLRGKALDFLLAEHPSTLRPPSPELWTSSFRCPCCDPHEHERARTRLARIEFVRVDFPANGCGVESNSEVVTRYSTSSAEPLLRVLTS